MADLARIKRNVKKMVDQGAPESDIDEYISQEGVTIEDVANFKESRALPPQPEVGLDELPGPGVINEPTMESAPPEQGVGPAQALKKSGKLIGSVVGGAAAGGTGLAGLPLQAAGSAQEFFTGERPAYTDIGQRLGEEQKRALGDMDSPEGRIAATAGEFAGFGGALRGISKGVAKGIELVSRAPITTDMAVGATYEGAREAEFGEGGALAVSLIPAIALGKAPKSDAITANKVEKQMADAIRNVRGTVENYTRNEGLNAQARMSTTFGAMLEHPTIGASVKALSSKSQRFNEFMHNSLRRMESAAKTEADEFRINEKSADRIITATRESFQKVIDDSMDVYKEVVKSGSASEAEAAKALHSHLAILEEGAHAAASQAYKNLNLKSLGRVSEDATKRIVKSVEEAKALGTVRESDQILLSKDVRNLDALVKNEIGTKVIPPKIKEMPKKKITVRRGRTVQGNKNISVEALNDIRSDAMANSRALKTANNGPTNMTIRLDEVVSKISEELEKFPALKSANERWKAYKNTFHDGQIATFFATKGSGVEKTSAERIHSIFVKGTEADRNAQQVKRVFDQYDKTGKMKNDFIADLKRALDSSLATKLEGKEKLAASEWNTWIRQNKKVLSAYDKHLGTSLEKRYRNFRDAAQAAQDASKNLSVLEDISFSQQVGGEIDRRVRDHLASGSLGKFAESMPNKYLKNAVIKRAASDLIDMKKKILSPQALFDATKSNKETIILNLGDDAYKRIEGITNAIRQEGAILEASGAPIEAVRVQLLTEGETIRRTMNLVTAVIGSLRRKGFKIAQAWSDAEKGTLMIEAFEKAMADPKAYRRIMAAAKKDPELIKNMWLLSTAAPVKEYTE